MKFLVFGSRLKGKWKSWLGPMVLVVLTVLIAWKNYVPGTWLTGWDTLHPEFDFGLNWKRVVWGVWRQDQGVGALAAHSHMVELSRIVVLKVLSFVFPMSALRYVYMFICLILGPLGVYYFVFSEVAKGRELVRSMSGLVAAFVYLFNLGTIQHFIVPFEMFPVQFAALGWLFWLATRLMRGKRKGWEWLGFGLISFFASAMAYAALLWYAYAMAMGLFLLVMFMSKFGWVRLKRMLAIVLVIFVTNAYWLLPNWYFVLHGAARLDEARINQNFSPEAFLQNKAYGTVAKIATLENFLFNWVEYDYANQEFDELMIDWKSHLEGMTSAMGFVVFGLVLLGVLMAVLTRNGVAVALLPGSLVAFVMIINMNPPFERLFSWLRVNLPLFEEGLRFPFTKFSILVMFAYAVFVSVFINVVLEKVSRNLILKVLGFLGVGVMLAVLVWYGKPMFEGKLIHHSMRVEIPNEYFELFAWMKSQPEEGRMAVMPLLSMWGWDYNDWGYQGAGFLWFGLRQPVFVRDFDRWSPYNESFYSEASFAFYNRDVREFEKVLEKYRVRWLLVDNSKFLPGDQNVGNVTASAMVKMEELDRAKLVKRFGFLDLYETDFGGNENYVWTPKDYILGDHGSVYLEYDWLYQGEGNYLNTHDSDYFPFFSVDERNGVVSEFVDGGIKLSNMVNLEAGSELVIPSYVETEKYLPVDIYGKIDTESKVFAYRIEVRIPELVAGESTSLRGKRIWVEEEIEYDIYPGMFSVGDNAFDLRVLQENESKEVYLGSLTLEKDRDWKVRLYDTQGNYWNEFIYQMSQARPRLCKDPRRDVQQIFTNRSFVLEAQGDSVCKGDVFEMESSGVLELAFKAKADKGSYPWFCIASTSGGDCINEVIPSSFTSSGDWSEYYYLIPLESGSYYFDFVLQGITKDKVTVEYSDFWVNRFSLVVEDVINLGQLLSVYDKPQKINVAGGLLEVTLPVRPVVSENLNLARGDLGRNCEILSRGNAQKQWVFGGVVYSAVDNGVSCDFFDYFRIPYGQSLVLRLKGDNFEGRGIKAYVFNRSTRRMDNELLLKEGGFDQVIPVLPKTLDGYGYTLNLETRSFGKESAKNMLEEVSFWNMPYEWLAAIKVGNAGEDKVQNPVRIEKTERLGLMGSGVMFDSSQGVVVGNFGYDNGWVGFGYRDVPCLLDNFLPWLRGQKLDHMKFNGWSNAWDVGDYRYLQVFYGPQYWEWLGFVVLFLGGLGWVIKMVIEYKILENRRKYGRAD